LATFGNGHISAFGDRGEFLGKLEVAHDRPLDEKPYHG
jgi:hypothetical protein